eukprot:Gb_06596 [translate_table: standard]
MKAHRFHLHHFHLAFVSAMEIPSGNHLEYLIQSVCQPQPCQFLWVSYHAILPFSDH